MDEAESLMVVARTGQDDRGGAALGLFVVPADAAGLRARLLPVDVLLPERQFTLHFDEVRAGPGALVGREGEGFRLVFHGRNPERIMSAALGVGVARHVLPPRPGTRASARSGRRRSAPTGAWRTRWPRPRSRPSWPS